MQAVRARQAQNISDGAVFFPVDSASLQRI